MPKDLYDSLGYDHQLHWVIASAASTGKVHFSEAFGRAFNPLFFYVGSHPHHDPDLTGAWSYLLNGIKWWVVFPRGNFIELTII